MSYSLDGCVNIEEYIPGDNVSYLSFIRKGKIKGSLIIDEINKIDHQGLHYGVGYSIPSKFDGTEIEIQINAMAEKLVKNFKLDCTSVCFSCRVSKNNSPVLIEIHLEIGGDLVWDVLIPESTGINVLYQGIQIILGKKSEIDKYKVTPTAVIYSPGKKSGN